MTAILLFVGTLILSLWATARVKSTYLKYKEMPASAGITGAQAAAEIMRQAGITDVQIVEHNEMLGDHYDPTNKRLVLSTDNYHGTSVAALGISAHECGHAIQHKIAYAPLQWRMAAVGVTNYANMAVSILPFIGMFGGFFSGKTAFMLMAIGWGIIMLFNLVTLPVEFDASRRAKAILGGMGMIAPGPETDGVNKTLNAAAWTYVAAFITSLGYLLYYLMPLLGGRSDDE
jgi:uncharacterized protein